MSFWKPLLSILHNQGLPLKIMILAFLLIGIEELVECNYKCPVSTTLRQVFISLYFIIPSAILLFLWASYQMYALELPAKRWSEKLKVFGWALCVSLFWPVILLSDGKYIDCAWSSVKGNNTEEIAQAGSSVDTLSKIAGLILFLIIFVVNVFYIKHYYKKMTEHTSSEEFPKWKAEGKASYLTTPEDSQSGNRRDISFHCVITKPPLSQDTGGQNTEDERVDPPTAAGTEVSHMGHLLHQYHR